MPQASITVRRGSRVPFRVIATGPLGAPLPPQIVPDAASSDDTIARVQPDPADSRRYFLRGIAPGIAIVVVGQGDNSLIIRVQVVQRAVPPDQVNRVDVFALEPEE